MPYLGNAPSFGDFPTAKLTGDGGASYNLGFKLPNENVALAFLNGAPQVPGEHFTIAEDIITFAANVPVGVQIYVHGLGVSKALITPSDGATIATPSPGDTSKKIVNAEFVAAALAAFTGVPEGYFSGFLLANNASSPNTTIDVGAGVARSFDNTVDIKLTGTFRGILQSSGAWAAGDNQNKLDTGARANNTWYSVFAIRKTSDGTADILFSLSATAPTMPSGYAGFRRISSIRTDGSGNILGFINVGNRFVYKTPIIDMATAPITVRAPYVMKVPTGVRVLAQIGIQGAGGDLSYWIAETDGGAIPSSMYYGVLTGSGDDRGGQAHHVMTNTSGQVLLETGPSVPAFNVSALGWTEIRG